MYDRFDAIPSRMPTRIYVEIFTELTEEKGQRIALNAVMGSRQRRFLWEACGRGVCDTG